MEASGALEIQVEPEILDGNGNGDGMGCIVRCMRGPVWRGDRVSSRAEIEHFEDAEAYISSISLPLKPTDMLSAVVSAKVTIEGDLDHAAEVGRWLYTFSRVDLGEEGAGSGPGTGSAVP
ncbi:hypothetical protein [Actinoplanes philippinensis]|uniref:hypothetical protein n=1 Tax=Actinoplanes philippinensis TaxID=35752 RepID=UPI0033C4364B